MTADGRVRPGVAGRAARLIGPWSVTGPAADRLGLCLLAVLVWDLLLVVDGHIPPGWSGAVVATTVAAFPVLALLCALALGDPPPAWLTAWRPGRLLVAAPALVCAIAVVLAAQLPGLFAGRAAVTDDVTASTICAARDVLAGRDPYRTPEVLCLDRLHLPIGLATPLAAGPFLGRRRYPGLAALRAASRTARRHGGRSRAFPVFGYPPLSFVWMLPVARGPRHLWVAWTLVAAALVLALGALASGRLWPGALLLLLLQFGGGSFLGAATQGDAEFFGYALAALALLVVDRRRTSAVLLALAVATNPLPWVVVPGYLVLSWRLGRPLQRLRWFAGALAVAVVPFLLVYRDAAAAIVALLRQPAFAYGIGLVTLLGRAPAPGLRAGLLGLAGLSLFGLVALGILRPRWRAAAPAVAVAVFWVSWRSDANYLAQLFLLTVAMVVGLERGRRAGLGEPAAPPRGRSDVVAVAR